VRRLALRASDGRYGAIVGSGAGTRLVRARGLGGYDQLDSGAGVAPGSLRATATQLVWRSGGARRAAPLGRADATPPPPRGRGCPWPGTGPEYVDAEVGVFRDPLAAAPRACRFRTGRRLTLAPGAHGYQRAGDHLLYRSTPDPLHCEPGQEVALESRSLVDGLPVARDAVEAVAPGPCPAIQTVLRARDGAFAYMADPRSGQPVRVAAALPAGNRLLDPGPGNELGTLRLAGPTLTWRNAGAARTAPL
jgi:hypothetical protein